MLQKNCFYKYNGPPYMGLNPKFVYKYLGTNSFDVSRFEDNKGKNFYIKDVSQFNKSGMNPNNWNKRNVIPSITPAKKPFFATPSCTSEFQDIIDSTENHSIQLSSPHEAVHHPDHYNKGSMEVIDMMIKLFGIEKVKAFCELNAFKYRMRAGYKGNPEEDISKAIWYEDKLGQLS